MRIKISEFQSFSLLPLIPLFFPVRMSFDLYRVEIDRRRRVPFKLVWGSGPNYVIFGSCWASVSICETCWVLSLVFQIPPEKVLFWGMFLGSKYRPFCGNPSQPGNLIFPPAATDSAQESLLPTSQHASRVGMACNHVNQLYNFLAYEYTVNK